MQNTQVASARQKCVALRKPFNRNSARRARVPVWLGSDVVGSDVVGSDVAGSDVAGTNVPGCSSSGVTPHARSNGSVFQRREGSKNWK